LSKRYKGKLDSDADDFINYAVDGANRMQKLINDLLAYSRVGRRGKEFKELSCERALDRALSNLRVAVEQSGAVVTRDPLPIVTGDYSQLVQLFQNLIGNAIKFCRDRTPCIHISADQKGNEWFFPSVTTASAWNLIILSAYFSCFSVCRTEKNIPGPA